MSTTPRFGGTNGVDELDLGQAGGARRSNNAAFYTMQVHEGPDRAAVVDQKIVQQNVAFEDNLGFEQARIVWSGTLKVSNDATLGAIVSDLNRAKHGSARLAGALAAPSPTAMKPTQLVNSFGRTLSNNAVLEDWSFDGPVKAMSGGGAFTLIVGLRVVFKLLG